MRERLIELLTDWFWEDTHLWFREQKCLLHTKYLSPVLCSVIRWETNALVVVQLLCFIWLFVTPWTAARQASLTFTISQSLLKLMSKESVMPSNHLLFCHPLLLLPSVFPSIRVFSSESALLIRWPKYWSFSYSISPSNEHPGLISFRTDWLDFLAIQGTLKILLWDQDFKASILLYSVFFMGQLSRLYMEKSTGKIIALTIWTLVGKVVSLLFNIMSRFAIAFLPRSKCPLISWLQSQSTVVLEPEEIKSVPVSSLSPSVCHEAMGPEAMICFWKLSFKPAFSLSSFTLVRRLWHRVILMVSPVLTR